ncbi:Transmembrane protein 107 [Labeo rohita]|uniref:Transmembrane protein 107 n=1 Tax=Labeo rohita TaxID=84645 RepID=A0ABQ8M187_LABRO|nr:Transmembrane protein 107 [Labeo rohita]
MSALKSLVPARFLTLAAHLVVVITIFWSRNNNIQSCLPLEFTEEQFKTEDTRLLVALSVTLGLFCVSLNVPSALFSHASACVSLSCFVFQQWPCWTYWIIFSLCRSVSSLTQ